MVKGLAMAFAIFFAKYVVYFYGEAILGELSKSILYGNLIFVVALFAYSNWVLADSNTRLESFKDGLFGVLFRLFILSSIFLLFENFIGTLIYLTGFVALYGEVSRVKGKFVQFELIKGFLLKSIVLISMLFSYTEFLQLTALVILSIVLMKEINFSFVEIKNLYLPKSVWMYSTELMNQLIANFTLIVGSFFLDNESYARVSVVMLLVNVLGLSYSVISNYFQKDFSTKQGDELRKSFNLSRVISGVGGFILSVILALLSKHLFEFVGVHVNNELYYWLIVTLFTTSIAFSFGPIGLILDRTGNSRIRFISLLSGFIGAIIMTLFLSQEYVVIFAPYLFVKIVPVLISHIFLKFD